MQRMRRELIGFRTTQRYHGKRIQTDPTTLERGTFDRLRIAYGNVTRLPWRTNYSPYASRSSSGLGHRPFTAATRVRLPYGTPNTINNLQSPTKWQFVCVNKFKDTFSLLKRLFVSSPLVRSRLILWHQSRQRHSVVTTQSAVVSLKTADQLQRLGTIGIGRGVS